MLIAIIVYLVVLIWFAGYSLALMMENERKRDFDSVAACFVASSISGILWPLFFVYLLTARVHRLFVKKGI